MIIKENVCVQWQKKLTRPGLLLILKIFEKKGLSVFF
jgi:hypothetical protein